MAGKKINGVLLDVNGAAGDRGTHLRAILCVADTAAFFGDSEKAIRQRVARKTLPYHRLGTRIFFLRDELEAFLRSLPGCSLEEAKSNVAARRWSP